MGWEVNATPQPLYPRERPGTDCIGGWVGPRAGLGRCGEANKEAMQFNLIICIISYCTISNLKGGGGNTPHST
jgi:hypothetical protein